jgi:hypothetical protein
VSAAASGPAFVVDKPQHVQIAEVEIDPAQVHDECFGAVLKSAREACAFFQRCCDLLGAVRATWVG